MGRPTITDAAQRAGMSKPTVSLVLNDSPLVADAACRAVRLRMGNVGLIGRVADDLRNPFVTEFAASAQMTFAAHGHPTVIANSDEDAVVQVIASMIAHGVSGLVARASSLAP